jgi:REP element-mobilizing transposase RayT
MLSTMPRPLRIEYEGAYYHVMNRGRARQMIFPSNAYYQAFLNTLDEAHQRFSVTIHAYCLMSNHYHLLLETSQGNLSRVMRHINGVYTQRYNRLKKQDGPLFRGRYKAIVVDEDAYLLPLSRYIHRNPIETRQPMVKKLERHRWSSYPTYVGRKTAAKWLSCNRIYRALGKRARVEGYKSYVEMGIDEEIQTFYHKGNVSSVLGGKAFRAEVIKRNQVPITDKQIAKVKERPSIDKIIEVVANIYHVETTALITKQTGRQQKNTARKVAMYLSQQLCDYRLQVIADTFGVGHVGSISNAIHDIRQEEKSDKGLARKLKQIITMI